MQDYDGGITKATESVEKSFVIDYLLMEQQEGDGVRLYSRESINDE